MAENPSTGEITMRRDWFKWSTGFFAGLSLFLIGGAVADMRGDLEMERVLAAVESNKDALAQHTISVHPLTEARLAEISRRLDRLESGQEKNAERTDQLLELVQQIQQRMSKNGI